MKVRVFENIERWGNQLPHPSLLFVYLCGLVLITSSVSFWLGLNSIHPVTGESITAVNLISQHGLGLILENTVSNFTNFSPVGTVLIAILGIGIAEQSGLIAATLKVSLLKAPHSLLTFIIVLLGVLSSLAADAGYVVLIPLAGIVFYNAGRNPIAGIAAAFAGVSGGYSANLMIGPIDAILSGISTEAAQLINSQATVSIAANYYFMAASTLFISTVCWWVTEYWLIPRLAKSHTKNSIQQITANANSPLNSHEKKGLIAAGFFSVAFILVTLLGLLPAEGFLKNTGDPSILTSPFIKGIVTVISLYAAVAGIIYGKISGSIKANGDIIHYLESSMGTMAGYLVLMFFAAQFVSYFAWSQLGIIGAIQGATFLESLKLPQHILMLGLIIIAAGINLFIGSASAKWALLAPIFVPMLMLVGIEPAATQLAFRIGDSSTNIITPLMPYFGVVVAFVQKYEPKAGMGTIMAAMLPYSIALLVTWSFLLVCWLMLGLPLGI